MPDQREALEALRALVRAWEEDSEPEPVPALDFPCISKPAVFVLSSEKLAEYQGTFKNLDVLEELRVARQWCIDNPRGRKTAAGMPKFLFRWLARKDSPATIINTYNTTPEPGGELAGDIARIATALEHLVTFFVHGAGK